MGLHLKTAAGLLLLVQALHLASLQHSTDSPRWTIDKSWLRELAKNKTASQNTALPGGEPEYDQRAEAATESSSDYSIASGALAIFTEEEENVNGQDKNTNEGSGDESSIAITEPPTVQNDTSSTAQLPEVEVSPTTAGVDASKSSQVNVTDTTEVTHNTTAAPQSSAGDLTAQNSTSVDNHTNHINLTNPMTTSAPEDTVTEQSTTKTASKTPLANVTQTTDTTTTVPDVHEINATSPVSTVDQLATTSAKGSISASASASTSASSSTSVSTPAFPAASASSSTSAFASPDLNTPEMANKTGKGSAEGSSSDRGLESDSGNSKKRYWGVVLGSMVAVGCVVAVTYVLLKRRYQKDFSHRKLVEEYPSEPVLRLDNCEPLDLTLGRLSYYNRGLQGDNIQMSSLHERN